MKLTSSRFSAAIGMNPHCSRQRLFRQLTGAENVVLVSAMQWGIDHEADAVAGVEAEIGLMFDATGNYQEHLTISSRPYEFGTTPDGIVSDDGLGNRIGLEVKCPQKMWDSPPDHYVPQLIGQAKIANLDEIYFSAWTPDQQRIWWFSYDESLWEWMKPLLHGFMDNLVNGIEPPRQKKPKLPEFQMIEWTHEDFNP